MFSAYELCPSQNQGRRPPFPNTGPASGPPLASIRSYSELLGVQLISRQSKPHLARLTNGSIKCERHLADETERQTARQKPLAKKGISRKSVKEMQSKLKLI